MSEPPAGGPSQAGASPASGPHRPWGWIGLCVLLAIVAAGLAIWVIGLQGDLDDERDRTAQAQQELEDANNEVTTLSEQIDQVRDSVSEVGDQISEAGADVQQNAQQALEDLRNSISSLEDRARDAIDQVRGSGEP